MNKHISLLLAALALHAAPAWAAENWIVYMAKGSAWGYDAESLKRDPQTNKVSAISATYTSQAEEFEKGVTFHYSMTEVVYDCGTRLWRYDQWVFFDHDAKVVKTVTAGENTKWDQVDDKEATDPVTKRLFGIGCEGKPAKPGGIPVGDMVSAMAKMKAAD